MIFLNGETKTADEYFKNTNSICKFKYNGELLYNVLMEHHGRMYVNNLICETLDPKNPVAKLYMHLRKYNLENQQIFIKNYNEFIVKSYNLKKKVKK